MTTTKTETKTEERIVNRILTPLADSYPFKSTDEAIRAIKAAGELNDAQEQLITKLIERYEHDRWVLNDVCMGVGAFIERLERDTE